MKPVRVTKLKTVRVTNINYELFLINPLDA